MLATSLGLPFDPDRAWDEQREICASPGQIVRTTEITQTATGHKDGKWTTVVAASILLD